MYKDKQKEREASKERMRRYRAKQGVTSEGVTQQGVTDNILVLSDGQMLDRSQGPGWHVPANWSEIQFSKAMAACNRARDEFVPNASLTEKERRALHLLYDSAHHPDGTYKEPTKDE